MAEETLVSMQIEDGAKVVERLRESGFDLIAAWWMKASEEGLWFLYIATHEVEEKGIVAAYRSVLTSMGDLEQLWVNPFEVKVVGAENRITKDVVSHLNHYPSRSRSPIRYGGCKLGNVSIEGAFIYPQPVTT